MNVDLEREDTKYEVSEFNLNPFINLNVGTATFNMKIAGDFNAYNTIAAYTVLKELGLNDEGIKRGFETYTSNNGRMQDFKKDSKEAMINTCQKTLPE